MPKRAVLVVLALILTVFVVRPHATARTVKPSGGTCTVIATCVNASSPGDTVEIFAGSYAGGTLTASGSAGNPINVFVHAGDTVTLTSTTTWTDRSYITYDGTTGAGGFGFVSSGFPRVFDAQDDGSVIASNLIIRGGDFAGSGTTSSTTSSMLRLYGDNILVENVNLHDHSADGIEWGGTNNVFRNSSFHDVNSFTSHEHIDAIQCIGGATPRCNFSLQENIHEYTCRDNAPTQTNCHGFQVRSCGGTNCGSTSDGLIQRYGLFGDMDGACTSFGDANDGSASVPNGHVYNLTCATGNLNGQGDETIGSAAGSFSVFNSIIYKAAANNTTLFIANGGSLTNDGNLVYNSGYSGAWPVPYSSETTFAALKNQNPLFVTDPISSPSSDGSLQAGSPAINAGARLTTVAASDSGSGTTLKVNDGYFFQSGWAGTQGDWIRIGNGSTVTQVTAVTASTGTITISPSVSRSIGDGIDLYKRSDGTVVLDITHSRPDVGGVPFLGQSGQTSGNILIRLFRRG